MSYIGLGRSQTEEGVMEIMRPTQQFNRWGPITALGQFPPLPDALNQFLPGQTPTPAPQTALDQAKSYAPVIIAGVAILGFLWTVTTTPKKKGVAS